LLVAIEDGALQTVWGELGDLPAPYNTVAASMDELVKSSPIASVFRTKERSPCRRKASWRSPRTPAGASWRRCWRS
jgi:hypothetical protein